MVCWLDPVMGLVIVIASVVCYAVTKSRYCCRELLKGVVVLTLPVEEKRVCVRLDGEDSW